MVISCETSGGGDEEGMGVKEKGMWRRTTLEIVPVKPWTTEDIN